MPVASSVPSNAANSPTTWLLRRAVRGSAASAQSTPAQFVDFDVEQVAQLLLLGPQVGDVLLGRLDTHRDAVDDLEPVALDAAVLRRVVRDEPHRRDAE